MLRTLLAVSAVLACAAPALASDGAVFTVGPGGTAPNGKSHPSKLAVHLTGGPEPTSACLGPGLADGEYYFQVTDPSGSTLLSSDGIEERRVLVAGGRVAGYLGTTHAFGFGGPCGAAFVQLAPFADVAGALAEYRVWLTPVASYDPLGSGFFGFAAAASEVDHFRVRGPGQRPTPQSVIRGAKFYDASEDGIRDPGEAPIPGWRVEIWSNGLLQDVTFTDADGRYLFLRDRDGATYLIREVAPGGFIGDGIPGAIWLATTPREGEVTASVELPGGPVFGNLSFEVKPGLGRTKGFWHNNNGKALLQASDPEWRETLTTWNGEPLCLRRAISSDDPEVSIFAPLPPPAPFNASFNDFKSWIVGPSHGHAGHILSTQVAAALLNYRHGFLQFTLYVDRFDNGILVSFEEMVTGVQTMLLCAEGAGLTGPHDPYQALRAQMLGCLNEFSSINETSDPTAPQIVYGPRETSSIFASPYSPIQ